MTYVTEIDQDTLVYIQSDNSFLWLNPDGIARVADFAEPVSHVRERKNRGRLMDAYWGYNFWED
jgi:hypothetical protein